MNSSEKVIPLHDRVLLRRSRPEEITAGGIHIPQQAQEGPVRAVVVAVGPGRRENGQIIPPHVVVGDVVLFGKYSGTEIRIGGEDHLIMKEEDILGVLTPVGGG